MKKFFVILFAAVLCVVVTLPAMAQLSMRGELGFEVGMALIDETSESGTTDIKDLAISSTARDLNVIFNYVSGDLTAEFGFVAEDFAPRMNDNDTQKGKDTGELKAGVNTYFTSSDKRYGAGWSVYSLMSTASEEPVTPYKPHFEQDPVKGSDVEMDAFLWWQVDENMKIEFGAKPGVFGPLQHDYGVLFGDVTNEAVAGQFALGMDINTPLGLFMFALYQPDDYTEAVNTEPELAVDYPYPDNNDSMPWSDGDEDTFLPSIQLAFRTMIGPFEIQPGAHFQKYSWDNSAIVADNEFAITALTLPVKYQNGPLTITGEVTKGKNMGERDSNGEMFFSGVHDACQVVWWNKDDDDANLGDTVKDSTYLGYFVEVSSKMGNGTLMASYGWDQVQRFDTVIESYYDWIERSAISVQYEIPMSGALSITPRIVRTTIDEHEFKNVIDTPSLAESEITAIALRFNVRF
jgi:hypothetical protein